jgi:ribosomal protein S3
MKFSHQFIENLKGLVQNIYNKSIVFNIVNLRKMHLNSDIFTQAVSLKLRNRDNKLYRVLKSSLRKLKIRNVSRARRLKKGNIHKNIVNQIRNDYIHSMFTKNNVKDRLNNLLLEYFPSSDNLRLNILNFPKAKRKVISLENYIYSILKHRQIRGIKVEAKGRLTRRFTASRSVFKMR